MTIYLKTYLEQLQMIQINTKSDPRIAEDFPNDPYSNLTILTQTQTLHLQLAFLSMDSSYFARIDPDAQQIDLTHIKEAPLHRVLHSLYGEQLTASSVSDLVDLYPVISFLDIEDYRKTIAEEVKARRQILQSIQFMELSFREKLCWEEVVSIHMEGRLKMLESSKSYLQLGRVSSEAFNCLLLAFIKSNGSDSKVVNSVMENYFNRNSIKPLPYLQTPQLQPLQAIWFSCHHISAYTAAKSTPAIPSLTQISQEPNHIVSEQVPNSQQILEAKRRKVAQMQRDIKDKDLTIQDLSSKIEEIKREIGLEGGIDRPSTVRSLVVQGSSDKGRKRQSKRLQDMLKEGQEDKESWSGCRKKSKSKDSKDLNRLGARPKKN